ncbi:hypothetical protein PN466_02085 [Roseofilum reptotaenium CS-1145]|uniref:Uncharacterized protein n=1 Tax=Roseofilum reptotaenium AO1-A TaxID=1925591 RepID=A0A1L9QNC5_9CYAN|nr:hypothetical protein [Roseofilum reptotaenium]MDB9515746.1 hypothetical protein [Roseofilum reptotaenium CS-1145]OJJ24087.1 hypothetical protein BI308_18615 [Roseofilum reptotaenium AO1-A]
MNSFDDLHHDLAEEVNKRQIAGMRKEDEELRLLFLNRLKEYIGSDLIEIIIRWNTLEHGSSLLYRDSDAGDYRHSLHVSTDLYTGGSLKVVTMENWNFTQVEL